MSRYVDSRRVSLRYHYVRSVRESNLRDYKYLYADMKGLSE